MADSIREQILKAIETRLETITLVNGYATALGANVVRVKRSFAEEDLPGLSIFDGPETFEKRAGNVLVTMPVNLHAFFQTSTPSTVASQALADVYECITDWTLTGAGAGLIDSIDYPEGEPEYPQDGSDVVTIVSRFLFRFNLVKGDPYSQP